jgi:very-short-patch-repair endonuclease
MCNFLETPEALLAAHDHLRTGGFSVASVISARTQIDARVWLGRWAAARNRSVVVAPTCDPEEAISTYAIRVPAFVRSTTYSTGRCFPVLLLPGELPTALPCAVALAERERRLPVAIACGVAGIVAHLLDSSSSIKLVSAALQGLVPVASTEQQVLKTVAEGRRLTPFLRGACEGLVYYMLEARQETRGRFLSNHRLPSARGGRSYEADIVCVQAKLVIEIDGPEHNHAKQRALDEEKHRDLEGQGYRVRRFSNEDVINDPVGVWRLIFDQLTRLIAKKMT